MTRSDELIERIKQMKAERKRFFDVEGDGVDVLLNDLWDFLEALTRSNDEPTEAMIEAVAKAIGEERETEHFFMRRAIDKTCYEVVHDLDPNGSISDETFKVVSTWPTADEAHDAVWDLTNDSIARAAIKAMSAIKDRGR